MGSTRCLGQTSVSTQYEIPGGVSADAGRARLGLRTQYPLSNAWSIDGSLEQILDFSDGGSRSAALLGTSFDTGDVNAPASYQFNLEDNLSRHLLSAGSNFRVSTELFGGVNALYSPELGARTGAEGRPQGFSFNVVGAYRGAVIDVLTSHTGLFGSLSPGGSQLTSAYSFSNVPTGTYSVTVAASGYVVTTAARTITVASGTSPTVQAIGLAQPPAPVPCSATCAGNNTASDRTQTVDAGKLTPAKSVRNVTTNSVSSSAGSGKPGMSSSTASPTAIRVKARLQTPLSVILFRERPRR